MIWVVLRVGCLECGEWSEVLCATADEDAARKVFEETDSDSPGMREPDKDDLQDEWPTSLVAARGTGGSYHFYVQLHKFDDNCERCSGLGTESIVVALEDGTWDEYNAPCEGCDGTGKKKPTELVSAKAD